ncbi:transcriptional regulator FixK [compost metagenome]
MRKEVIFRKDDILDSVGIIIHGNVLLCKDNISGVRFIFSELGDGEIIGETALRLVQEHSGYETEAGSECRILFIKINKIVWPGQDTCYLRGWIIGNMLALQTQKNNSACFEIPFTRSDLADYLTVDRSALSRELQRMAQDGLIRFNRNQFELLDAENQLWISDF